MQTANIIIGVALIVMAVFLVISVLMQHGKDHRLSGSIAGGAETFFGKTKGRTIDAMLSKLTTVITIIFVILVVVLYVIQPESTNEPIVDNGVQTTEDASSAEDGEDAQAEGADVSDGAALAEGAEGEDNAVLTDDAAADNGTDTAEDGEAAVDAQDNAE